MNQEKELRSQRIEFLEQDPSLPSTAEYWDEMVTKSNHEVISRA